MGTGQKTNNTNQFHFLIVGQGIAGSVLALSLIKSGYRVCVIDKPGLSLSSRVAAGIWNPVVFKRLTKSWLADELMPELIDFYTWCEKEFHASFITKRKIIKPFTEEQEKNLWLKKAQHDNAFLDARIYDNFELNASQTISPYSFVLEAGNLDVIAFLDAVKNHLISQQAFFEDSFQYEALKPTSEGITYKALTADNIVFCEGHLISKNPFFNWVPMKPAKGEVLTISCKNLKLETHILNKGIFIMPLGNDLYKVGATYEWETLNDEPTTQKKEELTEKLKAVLKVPLEVVKHEAGVRPAVIDRRPVIGSHPTINTHFVFNGFGTKAVMLAPYFAKQLVDHIQSGTFIDAEADVRRFAKMGT
jgi:glycine/D-amino acid oxidase-like deaminating enzyme